MNPYPDTHMDYFKQELFTFDKDCNFKLFQTAQKQETLHCHNCLELNLVEKGSGRYIIGGKLYEIAAGDIFIINNSERHLAIHNEEDLVLTVLLINMDYFLQINNGKEYLKPFFQRKACFSNRIHNNLCSTGDIYGEMKAAFECAAFECAGKEATDKRPGWQMVMEAAVNMLLSLLYRYYSEQQAIGMEEGQYLFNRLDKVLAYIDLHFAEDITLEQLGVEAAMSKTYLCKYFKDITGQTLFGYIEQVRVQYASYLLQTTDMQILQIAMESGFHSVSYFNRKFKRFYKVSPGQFRRTNFAAGAKS